MANQDGARPAPGVKHVPGAYPTPATRPFQKDADGCFTVPGDSMIKYNYANTDNNNQDSNKRPKPQGNAPDSFIGQPEGKPYDSDRM